MQRLLCLILAGFTVNAQVPPANPVLIGRQALNAKEFARAKDLFMDYLRTHPASVEGELGLADAELGLRAYKSAETEYRKVVAAQPELWAAHKNLVIVEAALGRWEEFDRERKVLRLARERGAPGITRHESDIIDSFEVHGKHWIVRAYDELEGRSLARYNFEHFGPEGHVLTYISMESASAAAAAQPGVDVPIGTPATASAAVKDFVLNYYSARGHGRIAQFAGGEPSYETARAAALHWIRLHPQS